MASRSSAGYVPRERTLDGRCSPRRGAVGSSAMSYRDDRDADQARIAALEKELEATRGKLAHVEGRQSQALVLAERLVDNERLNADCVEVMHLSGHHEFEQPADPSAAPCKHIWNRVAS